MSVCQYVLINRGYLPSIFGTLRLFLVHALRVLMLSPILVSPQSWVFIILMATRSRAELRSDVFNLFLNYRISNTALWISRNVSQDFSFSFNSFCTFI